MLAVSCIRQVVVVSVPATAPIGNTELPSTVTAPFLANAFPFILMHRCLRNRRERQDGFPF